MKIRFELVFYALMLAVCFFANGSAQACAQYDGAVVEHFTNGSQTYISGTLDSPPTWGKRFLFFRLYGYAPRPTLVSLPQPAKGDVFTDFAVLLNLVNEVYISETECTFLIDINVDSSAK